MIDQPPESLVRGCNDPVSIGVLSDWIEEQYGFSLDLIQSGWSNGDSVNYINNFIYGFDNELESGNGHGNGYNKGNGYGYGYGGYGSLGIAINRGGNGFGSGAKHGYGHLDGDSV